MISFTDFIAKIWLRSRFFSVIFAVFKVFILTVVVVMQARAQTQQPSLEANLRIVEQKIMVSATYRYQLPLNVVDAIKKGITLTMSTRVGLYRWMWWYFDQRITEQVFHAKISYQPLVDNFRVKIHGLSHNVATIEEAIALASRLPEFQLFDRTLLKVPERYYVSVEFFLNIDELPAPFQFQARTDKSWQIYQSVDDLNFQVTGP